MKKRNYIMPMMIEETFLAEQYVAANDCGIHVGTPHHGHFYNSANEIHCAFTSSNCGSNATTCEPASGGSCNSFDPNKHQEITEENGTVITKPNKNYHNCHILSTNEAAKAFADTYKDRKCANGVAALMNLNSFEEISQAFS